MRRIAFAIAAGVLFSFASAKADDAFTDGQLTVEWSHVANDYTGTFTLDDKKFPATGVGTPTGIEGSFQANGTAFAFTASRTGDTITLSTGGKTYTLKPLAPTPINPWGSNASTSPPAPIQPSPPAPLTAGLPAGYTVINHTDSGQAWSGEKADAKNVRGALMATCADLSHYFDEAPTIGGAYEDAKDHRTGGAVFTAKLKGQPIRGMISTRLTEKAAQVAIVYDRADAPPQAWKKLMTAPAAPAAGGAPDQPAIALQKYEFADGTGSVGIAEGWKTNAQSGLDRVLIDGPADQHVAIGSNFYVVTPDSQTVQMQRQLEAQSRQMGIRPPPPLQMLVAPFAAPADALRALIPQLSNANERAGGFALRLDQILSEQPIAANLPSGKAALLEYLVTRNDHGKTYQMHNMGRIECSPVGAGAWSMYVVEIAAPIASFDKDKPVMLAMVQSFKEDAQGIARVSGQRQAAQQQQFANIQDQHQQQVARFDAQQQAHRTQMAGYEDHNKQWAADQNRTSRANDDYVEMIRGYRTVIDTQTGEKASADYGNVDNIVNNLNERDPGRFAQIPLRDENDPVPNK